MKTKVLFSVAALTALTILSCQKENNVVTPEETPVIETPKEVEPNPNFVPTKAFSFVGITDNDLDPETKTSLEGTQVKWGVKDGIYLFDGAAPRAFVSDNEAVSATANFTGAAVSADKYYAIYPSGKISTVESKKVIATTIPTFQTATANSFAPKSNVAVAYSESDPTGDAALQFKNIAAVVKFKLNAANTDVRKVRLDAINGEDMTGAMNVTFNDDGTFTTASVHANSESCVILESNEDLDPAQTYYMAIKPVTYAGGFKITLIKSDGSFCSMSNPTSNTLERNDLVNFGTLPEISSWKKAVVDELTASLIDKASYEDWTGKSSVSDAVYAGNSQTSTTNDNSIQMRSNNSNSGIVTTTSGGKVRKVIVDWHSATLSGRTLNVYGKNTAYTSATNLYSEATSGELLGTIVKGTSSELTISGDYEYIGLRSANGAMYFNNIQIMLGDVAPADPTKISQETSIESVSSTTVPLEDASATFNVVSNGPWTIASNKDYATVSVDDDDKVTVTFQNLASGQRDATITVTPAQGDPQPVTITQKDVPATKTYTLIINNTSFTNINGGSGYAAYDGDHVITARASDASEYDVTINSTNVMISSSALQFKKSGAILYNKTDLGRIISISSISNVTAVIGDKENPSSAVANGGYFKLTTSGTLATTSALTITFEK